MKKILFAIAIVLTIGLTANAQGKDSFVDWDNDWGSRTTIDYFPSLPTAVLGITSGNPNSDPQAPLGSGLLVLTALGAGYAVAKKRKK
ncbi:MAG: hypothetical protein CW336_02455 [Bacteroidetes bacterium]|nr:hypothetical protein [Bacteroidota bacterium]